MWPKALIELLPHLTRLVPLANRYFQSRSTAEDANRRALERKLDDVALALRKDIAEATASLPIADISHQLSQQSKSLAGITTGLREMQAQLESVQSQVEGVDTRWTNTLLSLTLALIVVVCVLLVLILVKLHR